MNKNKADARLDDEWRDLISMGLSQQSEAIDDRIQARLRHARITAVSAHQRASWPERLWRSISMPAVISTPVAQFAVVMLLAVFSISLVLSPSSPAVDQRSEPNVVVQQGVSPPAGAGEMDVLMSNEDMDFLENLEIYEWLVAEYG